MCLFGEGGEEPLEGSGSGLLSGGPRLLPILARVDGGEGRPPFLSGFMAIGRQSRLLVVALAVAYTIRILPASSSNFPLCLLL